MPKLTLFCFWTAKPEYFARVLNVDMADVAVNRVADDADVFAFESRVAAHATRELSTRPRPRLVVFFNTEPMSTTAEARHWYSHMAAAPDVIVDYSLTNVRRFQAVVESRVPCVWNVNWLCVGNVPRCAAQSATPRHAIVHIGMPTGGRAEKVAAIRAACPVAADVHESRTSQLTQILHAAAAVVVLHRYGASFEFHRYWHFMLLDAHTLFLAEALGCRDEEAAITATLPNIQFFDSMADIGHAAAELLRDPAAAQGRRDAAAAWFAAAHERYAAGGAFVEGLLNEAVPCGARRPPAANVLLPG
jgi:hypothetical protein